MGANAAWAADGGLAAAALPLWLQVMAAALLVLGGLFMLVGAIGLLRFSDAFMRLHAPTKATTLGVGGVLLASMLVAAWRGQPWLHALLVSVFLFLTAPVSAQMLALAALHLRAPSRAGDPPGESEGADADPRLAAASPGPAQPPETQADAGRRRLGDAGASAAAVRP